MSNVGRAAGGFSDDRAGAASLTSPVMKLARDGVAPMPGSGTGSDARSGPFARSESDAGATSIAASIDQAFAEARRGDRAAFGRLVQLLQDRLFNAIYRMTHDRDVAGDLTQESFVKALEHIGQCRGDSQAYTWLFRIALNLVISRERSQRVRRAVSIDGPLRSPTGSRSVGSAATVDQLSSLRERCQLVSLALARLDADERALLVMRDIDEMDYAEMARVLEIPLGTLKSRLFRARVALRGQMESLEQKPDRNA
jgi:RNA polymerase sigma-70 factor (ECF subfamily)